LDENKNTILNNIKARCRYYLSIVVTGEVEIFFVCSFTVYPCKLLKNLQSEVDAFKKTRRLTVAMSEIHTNVQMNEQEGQASSYGSIWS
jgi:hypothetical protein